MINQRKNQVALIFGSFTSLLRGFDFGLETFEDGSIVFVDNRNGDRYKISAEDFQELYDKTEAEE